MKETIINTIIILLLAGAATIGALSAKESSNVLIEDLKESNDFKRELLNAQEKALESAHKIISKHDIADIDGSDEFAEYLEASVKVDSLLNTQL